MKTSRKTIQMRQRKFESYLQKRWQVIFITQNVGEMVLTLYTLEKERKRPFKNTVDQTSTFCFMKAAVLLKRLCRKSVGNLHNPCRGRKVHSLLLHFMQL